MKAIDLYAGIGGWSLGLRLAGIDVVDAYEYWAPALATYNANHGTSHAPVDLRTLDVRSVRRDIDIVVGSPPCTEFSYSNRGGGGDVAEGLKDLAIFFEVVRRVRPRFWMMENVPRVQAILAEAFETPTHPLFGYRGLGCRTEIVNFADFGLPQNRMRCIATNIAPAILNGYRPQRRGLPLGAVLRALSRRSSVVDPIWKISLQQKHLTEMEIEPPLDDEQIRMNREAKVYHPIYNGMAFPDLLTEPARTVTATCSRVSRESIIIWDALRSEYRRLTVRERASLQGFPITYQIYANSVSQKVKLVGNAMPPLFSYFAAMAMRGVPADRAGVDRAAAKCLCLPREVAPVVKPNKRLVVYPIVRRFRAALPNLRFKSGMRFELVNRVRRHETSWTVRFFYGPSTNIQEIRLDDQMLRWLRRQRVVQGATTSWNRAVTNLELFLEHLSERDLQSVWARRSVGIGPYDLLDVLGSAAKSMAAHFETSAKKSEVASCVLRAARRDSHRSLLFSDKKLEQHAPLILSGLMLGACFNERRWAESLRMAA